MRSTLTILGLALIWAPSAFAIKPEGWLKHTLEENSQRPQAASAIDEDESRSPDLSDNETEEVLTLSVPVIHEDFESKIPLSICLGLHKDRQVEAPTVQVNVRW